MVLAFLADVLKNGHIGPPLRGYTIPSHPLYSAIGIPRLPCRCYRVMRKIELPNKLLQIKKAPYSSKAPSLFGGGGFYHIVKFNRSR